SPSPLPPMRTPPDTTAHPSQPQHRSPPPHPASLRGEGEAAVTVGGERRPRARRSQRTQERWGAAMTVAAALTLEALPVTTWLLVLAAAHQALDAVPLPLWWLLVVLLLSWGGAVLFRRWQPAGAGGRVLERVLRFAILIGWVLTTLLSLSISPAAYSGRHPV